MDIEEAKRLYPSSRPDDVLKSLELGIDPVDRVNVTTSDYLDWQMRLVRASIDKLVEASNG